MLFKIIDWLRLRDLDEELRHARIAVIRRYARGNVSFQNGHVLDDEALDAVRAEGDRALDELSAQQDQSLKHATK